MLHYISKIALLKLEAMCINDTVLSDISRLYYMYIAGAEKLLFKSNKLLLLVIDF